MRESDVFEAIKAGAGDKLAELLTSEAALAGVHLLYWKIAAADAGLIGQDEKGNALLDESMHRCFDAGQELDLLGITDVVDVAN